MPIAKGTADEQRGEATRAEWRQGWVVPLVSFLLLISAFRIALTSSGQLYWPDEFRYVHALHLLEDLRSGDPGRALQWIFTDPSLPADQVNMGARPGYVVLSALPAVVQGVANVTVGITPEQPGFYRIAALANVAVVAGIAILLFLIFRTVGGSPWMALVGVVVYSTLVNTNLYVRHLFPYDPALLFLLSSLYLLIRPREEGANGWTLLGAGLLAGVGFTTYPGYDPFLLILGAAVLIVFDRPWRALLAFGASMIPVALLWELLARLGGLSFFELTFRLAGTLSTEQGSFSETLSFLPKYLVSVEGVLGGALLVLFVVFSVAAVRGRHSPLGTSIVAGAAAAYLIYGALGVAFHMTVQYGRLLHMYLPFVVLAAVLEIWRWRRDVRLPALVLVALAGIGFLMGPAGGLRRNYPRDIELALRQNGEGTICEIAPGTPLERPEGAERCDFVLTNARHFYPLPSDTAVALPRGATLQQTWDHPLRTQAYWFEGYGIQDRAWLQSHPLTIGLYRLAE